jgi:hypothetical protein
MALFQTALIITDPGLFCIRTGAIAAPGRFLLTKRTKPAPTGIFSVINDFGTEFSDDTCNAII